MAIKYTLKHTHANGQEQVSTEDFAQSEILIGRGASSDIRVPEAQVSLIHVKLSERSGVLYIEDLNSFGGTKVNHKSIRTTQLSSGDTFQIGTSTFCIEKKEGVWHLIEHRTSIHDAGEEAFVEHLTKSLSIQKKLPSMFLLSVLAGFCILLLYFIYPLSSGNKQSWSSGPISNVHNSFSNDCTACHQIPFQKVQDSACLSCHAMSDHAENISDFHTSHKNLNLSCGSCHMEHNGSDGIIIKESNLCLSCHASLSSLMNDTKIQDVPSFEHHPEFKIILDKNKGKPVDTNTLKLNHKVHLEPGIMGREGPTTLSCESCHQVSQDKKSFLPVTFEKDCKSCHTISFEEFSKTIEVPHGKPELIYNFLKSQYAALYLDNEGVKKEFPSRRNIPKGEITRGAYAIYTSKAVHKRARKMEEEVVNSLACSVCHEITKKPEPLSDDEGQFEVTKPDTPAHWLPGSIFNHSKHQHITCESCHGAVKESESSSDLLMPGIITCAQCHHDRGRNGMVESNCVMCHSYHEQLPLPSGKKITVHADE
jgi:predicted CXXCH cytochrome family protein